MKVDVKEVNEYTRELSIDIPWTELESDFNASMKKFSKKIKIPGFRAGKIPRDRLLQQFQPNIEADFMEDNFQKHYLMAVQQVELVPVNKAEISDVHFHMNEHFRFKAAFEVEPEITFPKLRKNVLNVQRTKYLHDDHDIEDAFLQLLKAHATINTVEDGAQEGDYIICELQKLDKSGLPIIGKKYEKQYLRVGKGSFTEDQKDKLIGLKPDDQTRLTLPINKEGETSEYELTVSNVEREILPEINEEFVKLVNPELESVVALRSEVEKKIQANFSERSQTAFERDLTDALIEKVDPSIAPSMAEHYLENMIEEVKKQNSGESLDEEKIRETYKPIADRNLKWYMLRKLLTEKENIEVPEEEVKNKIETLRDRSPNSEKEITRFYKKPSNRQRLEDDLVEKKILNFLEQFAKVKEAEVHTKDLRGHDHEH